MMSWYVGMSQINFDAVKSHDASTSKGNSDEEENSTSEKGTSANGILMKWQS